MNVNIRPGTLRAYAFGVFTGSVVTATMVMCAAPAKADVSEPEIYRYAGPVCATVQDFPSTDGLLGIGYALMDEGYTAHDAGQIIAASIIDVCPQYIPILRAFVNLYGDQTIA